MDTPFFLFITTEKKIRVFSNHCVNIMNFFLSNPTSYYTTSTAALSMDIPLLIMDKCVDFLESKSYLSRTDGCNAYFITKKNAEWWNTDCKNYLYNLIKIKEEKKYQPKKLLVENNEDQP